ncbi:MAG: AAA family ATPase [Candidatus Woesearchaeota archaeon]
MDKKVIIGVCGTLCSGKGVVSEILKSKGCDVITLGAIVRESLNSKNIATTREAQQNEGNALRKEFGGQILAERALKKYLHSTNPLVIDGIRNISEIEYLKKHSKFFLIGIDASIESRWKRSLQRNRDPGHKDYDKFVSDDARDKGRNEPDSGQQVSLCLVQADFLIMNDEEYVDLESSKLYIRVNDIYRKIIK